MSDAVNPVRMLALEQALNDLREEMNRRITIGRVYQVYIPNRVIQGEPSAAPTITGSGGGSVTENRDYAYTYASTEGDFETILSTRTNVTLSGESAWLSGARSTDARIDLVNIYSRLGGTSAEAYRQVASFANPSSGTWNYTDDTSYGGYLGEPTPVTFAYPLQIACGTGFRVRRVKLKPSRDLAASSSAYWIFRLEIRKNLASLPRLTLGNQNTKKVGLQASTVYNIPSFHLRGDVPNRDLDTYLDEDDTVYFVSRGVGAVSPLPNLSGTVEVTREAP